MAPCLRIGLYPLGSAPSQRVVRSPDCALAPLRANRDVPLFFNIAVTYRLVKARWLGFQVWLPPE